MIENNDLLWQRFIRLGEMIGDGDHEKWVETDYKRLLKILCPPTKEEKAATSKLRKQRNEKIDSLIKTRIDKDSCTCGSKLKQSRSGSTVVVCTDKNCGKKYKYNKKKK